MSRHPWGIKPSEVKRAVNAVLQTGLSIKEVKFEKGGVFTVVPSQPNSDKTSDTADDLKELL
jgi:hypothetical protein